MLTAVGVIVMIALFALVVVLRSCRLIWSVVDGMLPDGGGREPAGMCLVIHVARVRSQPP